MNSGGERVVDQLGDDVGLLGGDHRADLRIPARGVSDSQPVDLVDDSVEEPVCDLGDDVGALDPRAGLAGVREPTPGASRDGVREIGIGTDDLRILAPELQHRALHQLRADLADPAPDLDRAGEEDLPSRRLAERLSHRSAAVDGSHESLRKASLVEDRLDPLAEERRQARRLQDHPVAGH
jgi:hypothetical protein